MKILLVAFIVNILFQSTIGDWIPKEDFIKQLNEAALQNYRDGWAVGDSDVILAKSPRSFTFTWLPANNTVRRKQCNATCYHTFITGGQL